MADNASQAPALWRSLAWLAGVGCLGMASVAVGSESSDQPGRHVFTKLAQPSCTVCHTLSDAGSHGQIGPNLDDLKPDESRVYTAVTGGVGAMPPFKDSLSEKQRHAVAAYVAGVTGGSDAE